jgi:putative FmdB family regulatory protein
MPLYEYCCKKCGQLFDKLVPLSQIDKKVNCPRCQSEETEQQLSTFSAGGGCGTSPSRGRFR